MKGVGVASRTATRKTPARNKGPTKRTTTPAPRRPAESQAPVPPSPEVREGADARLAELRERAADALEMARHTAAGEAAALVQAAEEQGRQIRQAAATRARQVLAEVADEAGDRLRQATGDADEIRADAHRATQARLDEARSEAARTVQEMTRAAEERARALVAEAEEQAAELARLRRASAETAYRTALADATRIRGEAQEQANETLAAHAAVAAETDLARRTALLELNEQLAERRAAHQAELDEHRKKVALARAEADEQHELRRQEQREALNTERAEARRTAETEARQAAKAILDGVEDERQKMLKDALDATDRAKKERSRAEAAYRKLRAAEARKAKRAGGRRARGKWFWRNVPWLGLAAAVGLTAQGEFMLAQTVGISDVAAPLLPAAIDIYAVTAFRRKTDVPWALAIMAAANIAAHLANPGHGAQSLTVGVVLVIVTVVWRVHNLMEDEEPEPQDQTDADAETGERDRTDGFEADRTEGRTESPRTDRTDGERTDRTADRTESGRTARTAKPRTGRTATRTAKGRTANSAPARTDAECVGILRGLPRGADGHVTVNAARTSLNCNRDRAVRLLSEAGLLSPADAAKHLAPTG
jgi:hypothetical protein